MRRKRRKRTAVARMPLPTPSAANEHWSIDFVSYALADGRKFRCLTLVDQFTPRVPSDRSRYVTPRCASGVHQRVIAERGTPRAITIDNGPELAGKALDACAYRNGVLLDFIQPKRSYSFVRASAFRGQPRR